MAAAVRSASAAERAALSGSTPAADGGSEVKCFKPVFRVEARKRVLAGKKSKESKKESSHTPSGSAEARGDHTRDVTEPTCSANEESSLVKRGENEDLKTSKQGGRTGKGLSSKHSQASGVETGSNRYGLRKRERSSYTEETDLPDHDYLSPFVRRCPKVVDCRGLSPELGVGAERVVEWNVTRSTVKEEGASRRNSRRKRVNRTLPTQLLLNLQASAITGRVTSSGRACHTQLSMASYVVLAG
ncbi:uncharacterized protein LOC103190347 isoform X4 [Callorhinchus milii]|uniref:uncharacterized protein LOC103190347 isoform X4 n=1 Tax=Callorhinchus milii TaxID=7868 RepID=UPI001C3FC236|nr:uncharacterized protein LOC103190347 isoform X4 [Callorhinchus milii]